MDILRQLESCSERERCSRIEQFGVSDALLALPDDEAIAWLDRWLPSSVNDTWGYYLSRCQPPLSLLMEWLTRDSAHKVAALDALKYLSDDSDVVVDADEMKTVADGLGEIEKDAPSPRVEDLLRRIRHNWDLGPRRETVQIPDGMIAVARCLFSFEPKLVQVWSGALASAYTQPTTAEEFWCSLAVFAGKNGALAICDHREFADSVIEKLSSIRYSSDIRGVLQNYVSCEEPVELLCRLIAPSLRTAGLYIAALDSGMDCHWLTINHRESLFTLEHRLSSALEEPAPLAIY